MATKAMAPNVPMHVRIAYIDVFPNDTTKNKGKGYGASLSIKDDSGDRIYPKGFIDRNIPKLVEAGLIPEAVYDFDPAEKYSIPVLKSDATFLLEQPAGEKYPTFTVLTSNGKPYLYRKGSVQPHPSGARPIAAQEPDPTRKNPNAKTVPGGIDDKAGADSLVNGSEDAAQAADLAAKTTDTDNAAAIHAGKLQEIRNDHGRAFAHVVTHYVPMAAEAGVELDLSGVSRLTYQLFEAQQRVR